MNKTRQPRCAFVLPHHKPVLTAYIIIVSERNEEVFQALTNLQISKTESEKTMITEYTTRMFHDPENREKKNQVDELFALANKDIRYAHNKLNKVQQKVLNLSQDFFKEKTTEEKETLELLSTMYRATIIRELQDVVERATYMLEEFRKHQKNRFSKLDENFEAIADQIKKKRKERENSEDEYVNLRAQSTYIEEMRQLDDLKCEILHMKEDAQNANKRDAA